MRQAACRGVNPDLFFPVGLRGGVAVEQYDAARRVCAACPVAGPCLEYALLYSLNEGVWGGASPDDRRAIRRSRRLANRTHA